MKSILDHPLFANVKKYTLDRALPMAMPVHCWPLEKVKASRRMRMMDSGKQAMLLLSGSAAVIECDKNGVESLQSFYLPGDVILHSDYPRSPRVGHNLTGTEQGYYCLIPVTELSDLCKDDPCVDRNLSTILSRVRRRNKQMFHIRMYPVQMRIRWLVQQFPEEDGVFHFSWQNRFAAMAVGLRLRHYINQKSYLLHHGQISREGDGFRVHEKINIF